MSRLRACLILAGLPAAVALAVVAGSGPVLNAQEGRVRADVAVAGGASTRSVQDALLLPFDFPFDKPTPLQEVARHLAATLHAPVVIDRAAIDRQGLKEDDDVQLRLGGVRLKTGLKLLLDQLDLTYHVVPEDNLLIITDAVGSENPIDGVATQLKSLHRDLHAVQDAVDDLRAALGAGDTGGRMRKPTIIEEIVPEKGKDSGKPDSAPAEPPSAVSPPRSRPGA
jgi:hypothetical protein